MATVISKNLVLSKAAMADDDTAGIIAYQNVVTPNTITATSQTDEGPASNMANPATAWGWECADQPAVADAIEYNAVNFMPSPFDPSGWDYSASTQMSNVLQDNPSGSDVVGFIDCSSTGNLVVNRFNDFAYNSGDNLYLCFIFKDITSDYDIAIQFQDDDDINPDVEVIIDHTGSVISNPLGAEYQIEDIGGDYKLVQIKYSFPTSITDVDALFYIRGPSIGSQLYVQAAFFGKADEFPAIIKTQGVVPTQTVTIQAGGAPIDYIGLARHNLNQAGLTLAIKYNGATVVPASPVSEKQALLFLNNLASPTTVELIIEGATIPPKIAVLYAGKYLKLERSIYVGHTPITMGRDRTSINGVSENGQYLGPIDVRQTNTTSVDLQNLTPAWYRANLDPFFALSPRVPCFWAWRPTKYEAEVGYAWIEGNPRPTNQRPNGMMQVSWNFKGIV